MLFAERKTSLGFLGIQLHHFSGAVGFLLLTAGDVVHRRGPTTISATVMPILASPGIYFLLEPMDIKSSARTQRRVMPIFLNNGVNMPAAPAATITSPKAREQHNSAVASLWVNIGASGLRSRRDRPEWNILSLFSDMEDPVENSLVEVAMQVISKGRPPMRYGHDDRLMLPEVTVW
jgi:hypothetical protein